MIKISIILRQVVKFHLSILYTYSTAYISSNSDLTLPPFPFNPGSDRFGTPLQNPILFSSFICLSRNIVSN